MKRTSTFTMKEIANQNNVTVDNKMKKATLIKQVATTLHPACENEYFNDIKEYLNILISYGHKVTMKKNGGLVFKVGRTGVCEVYRCEDSMVHIYIKDENVVNQLVKKVKCYRVENEKWVLQNRLEFTKDSFVDFVLSDNLHLLTDLF